MADAQNERTNPGNRRRGRRGESNRADLLEDTSSAAPAGRVLPSSKLPGTEPPQTTEITEFVRPADIAPPIERIEVYCVHHMAMVPEHEPFNTRTNMTTLRHLRVDRFGRATLYCDCLHNGPHEWPPTLQRLGIPIELD